MQGTRHYVISVAGFDPSGGAGILADVKTFESHGVTGLGVCSAITFQTEDQFMGVSWIPLHQIELQLDVLLKKYEVHFLKIGLIQSLKVLDELIRHIRQLYPQVTIIWDPILKASAGFQFHHEVDENLLYEILSQLFLITPNNEEAMQLMKENDSFVAAKTMSRFCNVFLKSWKDESQNHFDVLFESRNGIRLKSEFIEGVSKHGSGCVLSAAITANLSKGMALKAACEEAKAYTLEFLKSSDDLLGEHHNITHPQHA